MRCINAVEESDARSRGWAAFFAQQLAEAKLTPLSNGSWQLGAMGHTFAQTELVPPLVQSMIDAARLRYVHWDFHVRCHPIVLRDASPASHGRVKAWRKFARVGLLPPVLLLWVSGLDTHVVLDGHDRLLAALLEGATAPALALSLVEEHKPDGARCDAVRRSVAEALEAGRISVERANAVLLDAHVPYIKRCLTRAFPIEGGVGTWAAEVKLELEHRGHPDRDILEGLTGPDGA
ncbi:MAG: hypothetical protein AAF624_12655 [Bacteroidota bacterium]